MLDDIKNFVSFMFLIPLVTVVGFYLSYKLRFLQVTQYFKAWKTILNDRDPQKKSTSFTAVAAVLGGNLGTGNIAGIAVALATGGPGSLFWMWIIAILGAILKFVGTALGILYRHKNRDGEFVGGPMYYLRDGLKSKTLAAVFCIFTILSALTVGNMVQMHSLALPLTELGISPLITGIVMSILVAIVIMGGLQRFSQVVSKVVPFMALFYIGACIGILITHADSILPAIQLIITSAFSPLPLAGGLAGFTVMQSIRTGFDRGLFATDVGAGLAPIIHASVESTESRIKHALTQGLISTVSPLVVMLVCALTGLVLIATDAWQTEGLQSTNVCIEAFSRGFHTPLAGHIVTITLFFFAYTTILTWSFCADKSIEYLFSTRWIKVFRVFFIIAIPLGALMDVHLVWSVADLFMNGMLIVNMTGLIFLSNQVIKKVRRKNLEVNSNVETVVTVSDY